MLDKDAVVYQDDDLIVIEKAPGISFHREGDELGLAGLVRNSLSLTELYPVHRLDKATSGLMVFAANRLAARELALTIREKRLEKFYLAISHEKPKKKQGWIIGDMTRARRGAWKLLPSRKTPAVTRFVSKSIGAGSRLFLLKPLTGRTHQLRVAMKSLGAPIAGDPLYGGGSLEEKSWDRTYLHSFALRFVFQEKTYSFERLPSKGRFFLSEEFLTGVLEYEHPWMRPWPGQFS